MLPATNDILQTCRTEGSFESFWWSAEAFKINCTFYPKITIYTYQKHWTG